MLMVRHLLMKRRPQWRLGNHDNKEQQRQTSPSRLHCLYQSGEKASVRIAINYEGPGSLLQGCQLRVQPRTCHALGRLDTCLWMFWKKQPARREGSSVRWGGSVLAWELKTELSTCGFFNPCRDRGAGSISGVAGRGSGGGRREKGTWVIYFQLWALTRGPFRECLSLKLKAKISKHKHNHTFSVSF